jgi:hypothetical protein
MALSPAEIAALEQAAYDRLLALIPQAGMDWRLEGERIETHIDQFVQMQQMLVALAGPWRRRQQVRSVDGILGYPRRGWGYPWVLP